MAATETNGNKNGAKPRWKRPKEKKKFTEAETQRINASLAVMEIIQRRKEAGEFDEFLEEENSKR